MSHVFACCSLLAALCAPFATGVASESSAPAPADAVAAVPAAPPEISLGDLRDLVTAKQVVLIDVNGSASFKSGHIPGAIDFSANEADLAKSLPADKGALIVAYCGGPKCGAWKRGAAAAAKLGYTNIKHFKDGISGWKGAKAPVDTAN